MSGNPLALLYSDGEHSLILCERDTYEIDEYRIRVREEVFCSKVWPQFFLKDFSLEALEMLRTIPKKLIDVLVSDWKRRHPNLK